MNTNKTTTLKFIFCILFVFQSYVAKSQTSSCDLAEFEAKYNKGRFEEVDKDLRDCLKSFMDDDAKYVDALRLLTMNSIMLENDDQAKEDVNQLLNANLDYNFRSDDPYAFKELVNEYRNFEGLKVTSVSKFEETLDEAPATIYVITAKDIENRGYLDIEQIFHDIPGFSISRSNGPAYSLLYPRGYRSTLNDKFLLLIDGIEENDLNSDNAVINRQVPLSNIKQIEVIYGPSSTMYGANAFSAVINIITKNTEFDKGNDFSVDIQTNYGTWQTNFVDATVSKKLKNGFISVTGRLFHSDEMDLTDEGFDYNFNNHDYLGLSKTLTDSLAVDFIDSYYDNDTTGYFDYVTTAGQESVTLTQAGANQMRMLDNDFYTQNSHLGFNNRVDNWFVNTKLKLNELTIGIETFKSNTGALPWYTRSNRIASHNLSRWITWNSSVYIRYEKKINQNLFLTNLASYRLHTLDGDTNLPSVTAYHNNELRFKDLFLDSLPSLNLKGGYFYRTSNQLRNELKLFYKTNKFNLVTGLEFRQGIFQMDYLRGDGPDPQENIPDTTQVGINGGNQSNKLDIGYFVQGKYSFFKNLSATLGGRVDYNQVRSRWGYGFVLNPRIALVYSKKEKFTFKAIYSEAFKDASFLTKYATTDTRIANPELKPEKVKNFEVSAIVKPIKGLSIEVNAFNSLYSNVVAEVTLENGSTQNQASSKGNNIKGVQATLSYEYSSFNFWVNYTYLNPKGFKKSSDSDNGNEDEDTYEYLRISDIPSSSANVGLNLAASKKLNINLRANYVGKRKTGAQTVGSSNPLDEINAYFTAHTNVNYELFEGLKIGILINNIFNQKYYHPGIRSANEISNSSRSLQNTRSIMFRAKYKL